MTDNYIPQTSASDRIEAVRTWLDVFDKKDQRAEICWHDMPEDFEDFLASVRALITPPHSHESLSDLALKIHAAALTAAESAGMQITTDLDSIMRNATNRAVYAGMQRAHETWEPEVALRPTQEQMLRWLGIRYTESAGCGYVYIPLQQIEREEI